MNTISDGSLPKRILDSIHDLVLVVGADYKIQYFNQSFENFILLHTDELVTLKDQYLDDILSSSLSLISSTAHKCFDDKAVYQDTLQMINPSNINFYSITGIPDNNPDGSMSCILIFRNVTDYELKKKELSQQIYFLSMLKRRIPIGIFLFDYEDENTSLTLWNPQMEHYFKQEEENVIGKDFSSFCDQKTQDKFLDAIKAINSTGLYYDYPSEEIETPQGMKHFHIVITPIQDEQVSDSSFICIMEDISTRVLQDKELENIKEKLQIALDHTSEKLEQTDAEFSSILKSSFNVSMFSLDLGMNYRFFNPHHESFVSSQFGIQIEKGGPAPFVAFDSDELGLPILNQINDAINGEAQNKRISYMLSDGKVKHMDAAFSPLYDADKINGVTVLLFDTTEQINIEEKAKIFQFVADNAEYGVLLINLDHTINYINPYWKNNFKLPELELLGQHIKTIFPEPQLSDITNSLIKITEGEIVEKLGIDFSDRSDKTVNTLMNFVPYGQDNKLSGGIAITCLDITTLEKAKETLVLARDNAEKASIQKSTFVANMSHEFRTPLNAILGFSSLLRGKTIDDVSNNHLESIISSGNVLKKLINEVLDFSKIEAGKMEIRTAPVNTHEFFKEIFRIFRIQFQDKNLDFEISSRGPIPESLVFDSLRMQQTIINLTNNALKFTHWGCVKLIMKYQEESHILLINIEDSGIGIASEDQKSVFETFEQNEKKDSRTYEGTGLGLAITKKIIHLMKGSLTLNSNAGAGSCFSLKIPMQKEQGSKSSAISLQNPHNFDGEIKCLVEKSLISDIMLRYGKKKSIHFIAIDDKNKSLCGTCVSILKGPSPQNDHKEFKTIRIVAEDDYPEFNSEDTTYYVSTAMTEIKRLFVIHSMLIHEELTVQKKVVDFGTISPEDLEILRNAFDLKIFNEVEDALPILKKYEDATSTYSDDIASAMSIFDIEVLEPLLEELEEMLPLS